MSDTPLVGRRIAVTRPRSQAEPFVDALGALGATAIVVPLVEIEPVEDLEAIAAVDHAAYDWVVFTSATAVATAGDGLRGSLSGTRVASVGPATADAVRALGVEPSFVPDVFAAEEIAAGLEPLAGRRVLLPQADIAERGLADELRERGALVDAVVAYRTVEVVAAPGALAELRSADAVVLMSGSAARSLAAQGGAGDALVVCIGPRTADAAREVGLEVGLVAHEATSEGIIHALTSHFGENE